MLDLRYSARELCAVQQLDIDPDFVVAGLCADAQGPGEVTDQVADVFDAELAKKSLSEFTPGEWQVNFTDVGFDANFVAAARAKRDIRVILPAQPLVEHDPLYRNLSVPVGSDHVSITSS